MTRPRSLATRIVEAALVSGVLGAVVLGPGAGAAAAACPNEAVRVQQGSTYLPDCRAYEMVSPTAKNGEEVQTRENFGSELPFLAARERRGVTYTLTGGIPQAESGGLDGTAVSASTAPGQPWSLTSLTDENAFSRVTGEGPRVTGEYQAYGRNLECGVDLTPLAQAHRHGEGPLLPPDETNPEQKFWNLYVFEAATAEKPNEKNLVTNYVRTSPATTTEGVPYFVDGVSDGCQKVIFETEGLDYAKQGSPAQSLYEWAHEPGSATGSVSVVSVLPDGTEAKSVPPTRGGSSQGASSQQPSLNQISRDGTRVFFDALSDGGPGEEAQKNLPEVYLHRAGASTIEVSAPNGGTNKAGSAYFRAASPSGDRVYFVGSYGLAATTSSGKEAPLTCANGAIGEAHGEGCDLYEYDVGSKVLRDLSPDVEGAGETGDKKGAGVRAVLGTSEAGDTIYFAATGQLEGKGEAGAKNESEKMVNIFASHEGTVTFVGRIGAAETYSGVPSQLLDTLWNPNGGQGMAHNEAKVSPDGQYLMVASLQKLTSYDNTDAETKTPDFEFYEFHLGATGPVCMSCKPDGSAPTTASNIINPHGPFPLNYNGQIVVNLLDDGRAFFQSSDSLLSQAVNAASAPDSSKQLNVYEWQPLGTGGCTTPTEKLAGCISLLDSGSDPSATYYVGASLDGQDVYLTTSAQLAPGIDTDGLRDMYDVSVNGGMLPPAAGPGNCEEAKGGCQGNAGGRTTFAHTSETKSPADVSKAVIEGKGEVESFKAAAIAVSRHKTKGSTLTLVVKLSAGGRVSVSGAGLAGVKRSFAKAGSYTIKVSLAKKGRTAVRHHHKVRTRVKLSFVPTGGKASSVAMTVTFR
jgi:hypothetical protein